LKYNFKTKKDAVIDSIFFELSFAFCRNLILVKAHEQRAVHSGDWQTPFAVPNAAD